MFFKGRFVRIVAYADGLWFNCRLAGFYPTTVSYLSLFYTRYEFGRRLGLFYGSYGIAGALGGIIAFVVFSRFSSDGDSNANQDGWKPWQILFFVEGCLTIVIAMIGFFWLPKRPGTAWFLSPQERELAESRIVVDRQESIASQSTDSPSLDGPRDPSDEEDAEGPSRPLLPNEPSRPRPHYSKQNPGVFTADSGLSRQDILSTVLFLPLILSVLFLNVASAIPSTAFSIFLPLVLSSLNLSSNLYSNILTAPPFLLASITLYCFTYYSDISRRRIIPILASLCIIIVGLVLTLWLSSSSISSSQGIAVYLALCLLLSGSFIPSPLTVAWYAGNIPEPGKRAIVLGINGYGNLAGVFAAYIFSPRWQDEGYRPSFYITLGVVFASLIGFARFGAFLARVNKSRARLLARLSESDAIEERDFGAGRHWAVLGGPDALNKGTIGGTWWDRQVRFWIGRKLLRLNDEDCRARRGDEKITFKFGL